MAALGAATRPGGRPLPLLLLGLCLALLAAGAAPANGDALHCRGRAVLAVANCAGAADGTVCAGGVCSKGNCTDMCVKKRVTCKAKTCKAAGTCDPTTGKCSADTNLNDGAPCSKGSCKSGVCTDLCAANKVTCPAAGPCQIKGKCARATGVCSAPTNKADGTRCSGGTCSGGACANPCLTGNGGCSLDAACSVSGSGVKCKCNAGFAGNGRTCAAQCTGGSCPAGGVCRIVGACNSATGVCGDGTNKADGTTCSSGGVCKGGVCTPLSGGAPRVLFSPYKDVGIDLNWNTYQLSTKVTGTFQTLLAAMPPALGAVTLAFATGECGAERWAGIEGSSIAAANVQALVTAGKKYVISTGGSAGKFTCGTTAGFIAFVSRYMSANMIGIDWDIEVGQTQAEIDAIVKRTKEAATSYPQLSFSFTIATFGASTTSSNLGITGDAVVKAVLAAGLTNYIINLMVMDYGGPSSSVCTLGSDDQCDMGASAASAANSLNTAYGVPFNRIALTPMIGGNDVVSNVFKLADVTTLSDYASTKGLAGVHFWSFDRDRDCPVGPANATCNSYNQAGTLGFTNAFVSRLGSA